MPIYSVQDEIKILDSTTTSEAVDTTKNYYLAGLVLPVIDTSTAITFLVSQDGITYAPLFDVAGGEISYVITNTQTTALTMEPGIFYPWEYVKVVVADAQTGDKTIKAIVRQY